jgi:hypothetical protein
MRQRNHLRELIFVSLAALLLSSPAVAESPAAQDEAPAPPAAETLATPAGPRDPAAFEGYWSKGQAEITSYTLEQARYGEIHSGQAVLIFVTEDMSKRRQVKLERPEIAGDDRVRVLKLNLTKKFSTGVYPYSMMESVFTPLDLSGTLKLTASVQEWCGQVFAQLNRHSDGLKIELRSYFESEGDQNKTLSDLAIEDDIWTRLRLDPASLETGIVEILPSMLYLRLSHRPITSYAARATMTPAGPDGIATYLLEYPDLQRTLTIRYRAAFPYEIESWEEKYPEGRGGTLLTTRAVRKERLMLDYWNHNGTVDAPLRKRLGLE